MVDLRIIFMGTPEFAVESLRALVENNYAVVAVITAPDRKKGRGQAIIPSPVKEYALTAGIPVLQPTNLKDPDFIKELASFEANLQVVVAFRMLPESVWNMPKYGTLNLHASLLPDYRGAAPINWAIINGEKETGVTTFFLKHEIDTGEIIFQEKEPIANNDTVGMLYERLMTKGANLVVKTVEAIAQESLSPKPQNEALALNAAPKIFKETCEINWNLPLNKIRNLVRGLNPYPAAWTTIDGQICKIFEISPNQFKKELPAGTVVTDHRTKILVKTAGAWVSLDVLQLAGKKRMHAADLLRGNPLNNLETAIFDE